MASRAQSTNRGVLLCQCNMQLIINYISFVHSFFFATWIWVCSPVRISVAIFCWHHFIYCYGYDWYACSWCSSLSRHRFSIHSIGNVHRSSSAFCRNVHVKIITSSFTFVAIETSTGREKERHRRANTSSISRYVLRVLFIKISSIIRTTIACTRWNYTRKRANCFFPRLAVLNNALASMGIISRVWSGRRW